MKPSSTKVNNSFYLESNYFFHSVLLELGKQQVNFSLNPNYMCHYEFMAKKLGEENKIFDQDHSRCVMSATLKLVKNTKPSEGETDFFEYMRQVNQKQRKDLFNCMMDIADQNISRLAPALLADNSLTNKVAVNEVISAIESMLVSVQKLERKQADKVFRDLISPEQSIAVREMTMELINNPSGYQDFRKKSKDFQNVAGGWLSAWMLKIVGLVAKLVYDKALGNAWIKLADEKLNVIAANTRLEAAVQPFNPKP